MSRPSANPQGNATVRPATTEVDHAAPFTPPAPPAGLNTHARRIWAEVWDAGREAYNEKTDAAVIERYAEMTARRSALLATLESEGWTVPGSQGQLVAHPAAKLLDSVDSKLQALEDRLGLNPEARLRLGIATVEGQSKLAAFLAAD